MNNNELKDKIENNIEKYKLEKVGWSINFHDEIDYHEIDDEEIQFAMSQIFNFCSLVIQTDRNKLLLEDPEISSKVLKLAQDIEYNWKYILDRIGINEWVYIFDHSIQIESE